MELEKEMSLALLTHLSDDFFVELHVVRPVPKVEFESLASLAKKEVMQWRYKVVGKIHNNFSYNIDEVGFTLQQQWGRDVENRFSLAEHDLFFVETTSKSSLDVIVCDGCWTFGDAIVMFSNWDPKLFYHNEFTGSFETSPVWIKVTGLPFNYVNENNIAKCTAMIETATGFDTEVMDLNGVEFTHVHVMIDPEAPITRLVEGSISDFSSGGRLDFYDVLSLCEHNREWKESVNIVNPLLSCHGNHFNSLTAEDLHNQFGLQIHQFFEDDKVAGGVPSLAQNEQNIEGLVFPWCDKMKGVAFQEDSWVGIQEIGSKLLPSGQS